MDTTPSLMQHGQRYMLAKVRPKTTFDILEVADEVSTPVQNKTMVTTKDYSKKKSKITVKLINLPPTDNNLY